MKLKDFWNDDYTVDNGFPIWVNRVAQGVVIFYLVVLVGIFVVEYLM